ncbi:MAG: TOBE domain-containing protein, partial [Campylobacteraceae bacterium]|nr:TOBE domain-containing protein [Campylobacteraceae bacterium]
MKKLTIESTILINRRKRQFINKKRIELLKQIDKTGSLLKGAKAAKMSYKSAWDALRGINKADPLLVKSIAGGRSGGGSVLTDKGHLYVKLYDKLCEEQQYFFDSIEEHMDNYDEFERILSRRILRTSARNQLHGKITAIEQDGLMSIVEVYVDGILIKASITTKSAEELTLKVGSSVWLIIKASWIEFAQDENENIFDAVVSSSEIKENNVESSFLLGGKVLVASLN